MSVLERSSVINQSAFVFLPIEPARIPLVDRFYRAHGYKIKCSSQERIFALTSLDGEWVASARLIPQASGHYWLRNLLVAPEYRGHGLATHLLNQVKSAIAPRGCYCFALPHLTNFYDRLGFERDPQHCPADISATYSTYRSRGRDWILMGFGS